MLIVEILFSDHPSSGVEMKNRKYSIEVICPIAVNGVSTGLVAVHVIMIKVASSVQNINCDSGRKVIDRILEVWVNGIVIRIETERIRAIVPPSLLGIDRRMP